MKKLPNDFALEKYGLKVRLVNEEDSSFILNLRTNGALSRFLHSTEPDIEKQKQWIRNYKNREREGTDYYFIYHKDGVPVGLNRIYNISDYFGTIGSWICSLDNEAEVSMGTYYLMMDIFFDCIGLDLSVFDVRKGNKQVLRLHKRMGAQGVGESEQNYYFCLNRQTYYINRDNYLQLLNIK